MVSKPAKSSDEDVSLAPARPPLIPFRPPKEALLRGVLLLGVANRNFPLSTLAREKFDRNK